jgi:hypothetical protein
MSAPVDHSRAAKAPGQPALFRGIGLLQGISLNMIGVGPFITLPLIQCDPNSQLQYTT